MKNSKIKLNKYPVFHNNKNYLVSIFLDDDFLYRCWKVKIYKKNLKRNFLHPFKFKLLFIHRAKEEKYEHDFIGLAKDAILEYELNYKEDIEYQKLLKMNNYLSDKAIKDFEEWNGEIK